MNDDVAQRRLEQIEKQIAVATADAADRVRNQAAIASDAMKALLLANGGAMVALFSFVGNVLSKAPQTGFAFGALRWAFVMFVVGFALALVAHLFAFVSQDRYYHQAICEAERLTKVVIEGGQPQDRSAELRLSRQGGRAYMAGLSVAAGSIILFVVGCGFALHGVLVD